MLISPYAFPPRMLKYPTPILSKQKNCRNSDQNRPSWKKAFQLFVELVETNRGK